MDGEERRRQQIVVQRASADMATPSRVTTGCLRDGDARLRDAARGDDRAGFVEERDLAELAELEDVVLEDPVLLPLLEAGVLEVGGERLEQLGVGRDVAADFLGGARGDVDVAGDDRFARAALERDERRDAEGEERQDGDGREQQGEARR